MSNRKKAVLEGSLGGFDSQDIEALYSIALDTISEGISSQLGERTVQFQHGEGGVRPTFKSSS